MGWNGIDEGCAEGSRRRDVILNVISEARGGADSDSSIENQGSKKILEQKGPPEVTPKLRGVSRGNYWGSGRREHLATSCSLRKEPRQTNELLLLWLRRNDVAMVTFLL